MEFNSPVCDSLAAIARSCEEHALGLGTTIHIQEAGNVEAVPAPTAGTHTVAADITLVDGVTGFYPWRIAEAEAQFTSTAIGVKGNQSFRNTLTVFVPLLRTQVEHTINKMLNGAFVIAFTDVNGARRILGNTHSPAMIPDGGIVATLSNERNGVVVTFENKGKTPFFYTGVIAEVTA